MTTINDKNDKVVLEDNLQQLKDGLSNVEQRKKVNKQRRGISKRNCEDDMHSPQTFEELDEETIKTMETMIKENQKHIEEHNNDSKQ